jgi:peptidyl-prolyl cis-trans isomerase A (cyclophilin A)
MKPWITTAILCMAAATRTPAQIHADFQTSLGNFTCELHYQLAPRTVANFIGLAEGSRKWIDMKTGTVRGDPFYNGVTFHRVISGFMNQSGSRNGLGTDGPGYTFNDEFNDALRHSAPYVLSMANSGTNTNGSQFFITVEPTPWLDNKHSVFGAATSGHDVIEAINAVATGPDEKPLQPVVIHSVTIRREGAQAQAFDIHAWNLPVVEPLPGRLLPTAQGAPVIFQPYTPQAPGGFLQVFQSGDLSGWARTQNTYQGATSSGGDMIQLGTAQAPKQFYQISQTRYPDALGPTDTRNQTLVVKWPVPGKPEDDEFVFNIDASGQGGTATYTGYPGETYDVLDAYIDYTGLYSTAWIIQVETFGYFAIDSELNSKSGNVTSGVHDFYIWQPGWAYIGSGDFTMTVPQ